MPRTATVDTGGGQPRRAIYEHRDNFIATFIKRGNKYAINLYNPACNSKLLSFLSCVYLVPPILLLMREKGAHLLISQTYYAVYFVNQNHMLLNIFAVLITYGHKFSIYKSQLNEQMDKSNFHTMIHELYYK